MGWDSKSGLRWKIEKSQSSLWEHTDSIMTTWKSKVRSDSKECTIKNSIYQIKIIHNSLAMYGIADA
jgi:hypothetical protein